jgi:hypothetical protein
MLTSMFCIHVEGLYQSFVPGFRNEAMPENESSLAGCRTLESSAANRPRRSLFCQLLAPWNNHAAVNPAKSGLGGVDFRIRRPNSDRLLARHS